MAQVADKRTALGKLGSTGTVTVSSNALPPFSVVLCRDIYNVLFTVSGEVVGFSASATQSRL